VDSGKKKRLKRIFRNDGKTVIIPMDHGVTIGPISGLARMQDTINQLLKGEVDAFVLHRGIARNVDTGAAGLIVHLSASTSLCSNPDNKVQVCSVEEALRIGADAVSVHINVGAEREEEMLGALGRTADDCDSLGLPLIAMMYPRGPKIQSEHAPDVIAHVARLGAELGADVVKTNYTGSVETFRQVVRGCDIPVIIAGGPKTETIQGILQMASDSIEAGASGLSIGRNVFQHQNPALIAEALTAIVHSQASIEEALRILGEKS
jgi:fructose-bisphosphate aldolase/2-amino-3,7-dideoxy-D-threo-hept-6-ulosonate synthase